MVWGLSGVPPHPEIGNLSVSSQVEAGLVVRTSRFGGFVALLTADSQNLPFMVEGVERLCPPLLGWCPRAQLRLLSRAERSSRANRNLRMPFNF